MHSHTMFMVIYDIYKISTQWLTLRVGDDGLDCQDAMEKAVVEGRSR